jgi:predicted phosphodiesterase
MRRIALFSDIHANLPALEAVLGDIDHEGVEERYCLGDLVGYGPQPREVVDLVRREGVPTIKGNYDEGIGSCRGDCGCHYATDQQRSDGAFSYDFTLTRIDDERARWLFGLPDELRLDEAGVRVVLAHGSPRKINEYLLPDRAERQLVRLADQAAADVVCVGHVHVPYHRSFSRTEVPSADDGPGDSPLPEGRVHYVSSGSVGKPKDGDPRAGWMEVVIGGESEVREAARLDEAAGPAGADDGTVAWVGAVVHRVDYPVEDVARMMIAEGLPVTLADALRTG